MAEGYAGLSKQRGESPPEPIADSGPGMSGSQSPGTQKIATPLVQLTGVHPIGGERRGSQRPGIPRVERAAFAERGIYGVIKRTVDLIGATLALMLFSPLIAIIMIGAYLSGGSPFFLHRRVGRGGMVFDCMKFRTMVRNADQVLKDLLDSDRVIKEEWLRDHKLKFDPRVTSVGRFLRRTSLDELPQLWNVIRGEMSLVGPRPVVPEELGRYRSKVSVYLSARPGITGLWQVSGRNNTDYGRRVALDVCYVRSRSILLDIWILLRTIPAVFASHGAY